MKWFKVVFVTLIVILDLVIFVRPVSTSSLDMSTLLPILKIAIVNSYDIDHVCGSPQTQGIISGLARLEDKYQLDIQVWYMKTDITFNTPDKIDYISKKVIDDIAAFKPDYIFTVDDNAFKNVGIPFSKTHHIFFSGLNKPFIEYVNSENDMEFERFNGIEEILELERFFKVLSKLEYYPSKFWILSDSSTTSYFLSKIYSDYIKKNTSFSSETIVLHSVVDLRSTISKIQKEKSGVIVYTFQTLQDRDYGVTKSKKSLINDMLKYNKKHLELCENCYYSKKGISMVLSPDFYKMGIECSLLFVDFITNTNWDQKIKISSSKFSINIKRLEDLGFSWMYGKIIEGVDGSYAIY